MGATSPFTDVAIPQVGDITGDILHLASVSFFHSVGPIPIPNL